MLILDQSQKEIQKAAAEFAKGEFDKDQAIELEKGNVFPKKIWKKAADLGFVGIHLPEAYGGGGLGLLDNVLVAEAFCRKDSSFGCALMMSTYASECIVHFGGEGLKEKYLPGIAEGRLISGGAFLENGLGYDDDGFQAVAVKEGENWVVNGEKTNVLNGGSADLYLVLAKTFQTSGDGDGKASMLIVDGKADGLTVADKGRKIGLNMVAMGDLSLTNVTTAADHLVGVEGKGMQQRMQFMDESRVIIAGQALGIAAGAMDRALQYVKQREQFGRKIGQFEITRYKLAEMATQLEQARAFTYQAAAAFDHTRKQDGRQAAMAKMIAVRAALAVADEAIQLHGGYGYMTEYEVERFYRDAKALDILEGGRRGILETVGQSVIGKIR